MNDREKELVAQLLREQPRRRGRFATRLAVRSILTGVVAIIVGYFVQSTALNRIRQEEVKPAVNLPPVVSTIAANPGVLPFLPVPGIILGVAAMILRPLRGILASLAALMVALSIAAIIGSLVVALAPMYQMPDDLDLLG